MSVGVLFNVFGGSRYRVIQFDQFLRLGHYLVTIAVMGLTLTTVACSPQPELLGGGINSQAIDRDPAYSSDGNYLAFTSDRRGHRDIYLFNLDTKKLMSLPGVNRRDSSQEEPALSADGRYLAYVSNQRGRRDIFIYDRDRQEVRLLSSNIKGSVADPTIKGDGSEIAFASTDRGQWKISVVNNPWQ